MMGMALMDDAAGDPKVHLAGRSGGALDRRAWRAGVLRLLGQNLIDLDHAVIVDVGASTAVRQAEVIERRVDMRPMERNPPKDGEKIFRLLRGERHGS